MGTELEYGELGFRCGLEIHQQLAGRKLFCSCPSQIRKDKPDYVIHRRLRASAGETGEVDRAAKHEMQKAKEFKYECYDKNTCLVELDEEPPHSPSPDALEAALMMAKLMDMKLVDSIQFMRKTVIDGSNVCGFQRTALVGYDGTISVNGREIKIATLCLEEEAAQIIERAEKEDVYNLSRLGIPLLEIATDSYIKTPQECMDVAAHIGMLLRSTGKALRGIGTIRQDVNISIKGGARTEIKGFQEYKSIPEVIDHEIKRQLDLVRHGKPVEPSVRKAEPDMTTTFQRPMPGADRMYPETDIETIVPKDIMVERPETIEEKQVRYIEKYGLSKDLAYMAVKYEQKEKVGYSFEKDFNKYISNSLNATTIADTILIKYPDAMKKNDKEFDFFDYKNELLTALSSGKLSSSAIPEALKNIATAGSMQLDRFEMLSDDDIEKEILSVIEEHKGSPRGLIMGKAMARLKGRADGKKVNEMLDRLLK